MNLTDRGARLVGLLFVGGCFLPVGGLEPHEPAALVASSTLPKVDSHPSTQQYAEALYTLGDEAGDGEINRAAFRRVCLKHQLEREALLDQLHQRAQIHAFSWRAWYERHCTPLTLPDGRTVVQAERGEVLDEAPWLCETDAGAPPARVYVRDADEVLAQEQRDACEKAQ